MDTRDYELMYIIRPNVPEEEVNSATERVDSMIGALGGQVGDKQPWGKRKLAYPIDKFEDGYYVVTKFQLQPARTADLEEQLRISDEVIRHIIVQAGEPDKKAR